MAQDQEAQKAARRWGGKVLVLGVIILAIAFFVSESSGDPTGLLVGLAIGVAGLAGIVLAIVGLAGLILKR